MMQVYKLFTIRWHSFYYMATSVPLTFFATKDAELFIFGNKQLCSMYNCRKCKINNRSCSVGTYIEHILTVIVCSITVWYQSNNDNWQPMDHFYVWSLASRSFVAAQLRNHLHTHYPSDGWSSQHTFPHIRMAIYAMLIGMLIFEQDSLTSSPVMIQLLFLNIHDGL
jgi:hypothetical protein